MVKVNYFYQGFIGPMMAKEFETKVEAENFLEENKESYNKIAATIIEAE